MNDFYRIKRSDVLGIPRISYSYFLTLLVLFLHFKDNNNIKVYEYLVLGIPRLTYLRYCVLCHALIVSSQLCFVFILKHLFLSLQKRRSFEIFYTLKVYFSSSTIGSLMIWHCINKFNLHATNLILMMIFGH